MLGSLALLTSNFPNSRLQVGQVGRLFGERTRPGYLVRQRHAGSGAFSACVVTALTMAQQRLSKS